MRKSGSLVRNYVACCSLLFLWPSGIYGQSPTVTLSPASLNFGSLYVGKTSPAEKVTLTNTGGQALSVANIVASGDYVQTNNCAGSIAPGGDCTISIAFRPTTTGTRAGVVTITDNGTGSPQTIQLTGTGIVAIASISPTSLTFSGQNVETTSAPQVLTLTDTGHSRLTISSIVVTGDFSSTNNCSGLVQPNGGACAISVVFSPAASGTRTGSLVLTDNALDSPQKVSLAGTGLAAGVVPSPASLTFAEQAVGTSSAPQSVTLTNENANAIGAVSITASGDYSETNNCGSSVSSGSACTIEVTFTPTASGARAGAITVSDTDPSSPQVISLTGSATGLALSPATLSFGSENVGTKSSSQTITLSNAGTAPVSIVNIVASGDFTETNNCGNSVASKSSCAIKVTFAPSAAGSRSGFITLSAADSATLRTATLSGVGQVPSSTVSVSPRVASLTPTQTQQFTAKISGVVSSNVQWSVDGVSGGNGSVGTISAGGLYSPPGTAGSHQVTATSIANSSQSSTVSVIVTDYAGTFTQHNDNARTGANLNETVLTTGNVNQAQFGKVFSDPVNGYVYAQPLYVANVSIPGKGENHNVVYIATEHDSVYAFDADTSTSPLWQVSFIDPSNGVTTIPSADVGRGQGVGDITPEIGITSTPVIDPDRGVLYVVAATKETAGNSSNYVQKLHALDITTGAEMPGSPVVIQASVPGIGSGSNGTGKVPFAALRENQRSALLLLNGVVYIAWGSHEDINPFHGWMMGYDANTLQQAAVYNDSPNNQGDGMWMSGAGLAADDSGNIFLMTGDNQGTKSPLPDYNDSFMKLSTTDGLTFEDFFAPFNRPQLSAANKDLGSGGPLLLPDQPTAPIHLVIGGGKDGTIFLLDRDNLGGFNSNNNNQAVQSLPHVFAGEIHGSPALWQNNIYFAAVSEPLQVFRLFDGQLSTSPVISAPGKPYGFPGASPTISANGAANGIVWVLRTGQYGQKPPGPSVLEAYDAANVSRMLYASSQAGTRDQAGPAVKFTVPTVANGKVYVGTQNQIDVYGLLP